MVSQLLDWYNALPISLWVLVLGSIVGYHAVRAVYLIYFSPLAIFPGSKWAALGE